MRDVCAHACRPWWEQNSARAKDMSRVKEMLLQAGRNARKEKKKRKRGSGKKNKTIKKNNHNVDGSMLEQGYPPECTRKVSPTGEEKKSKRER